MRDPSSVGSRFGSWALVASTCTGCEVGAFLCHADAQCGAAGGACEPTGYCSFPDEDCPSGRRYGEHSAAQSGRCVQEPARGSEDGGAPGPTDPNGNPWGSETGTADTGAPAPCDASCGDRFRFTVTAAASAVPSATAVALTLPHAAGPVRVGVDDGDCPLSPLPAVVDPVDDARIWLALPWRLDPGDALDVVVVTDCAAPAPVPAWSEVFPLGDDFIDDSARYDDPAASLSASLAGGADLRVDGGRLWMTGSEPTDAAALRWTEPIEIVHGFEVVIRSSVHDVGGGENPEAKLLSLVEGAAPPDVGAAGDDNPRHVLTLYHVVRPGETGLRLVYRGTDGQRVWDGQQWRVVEGGTGIPDFADAAEGEEVTARLRSTGGIWQVHVTTESGIYESSPVPWAQTDVGADALWLRWGETLTSHYHAEVQTDFVYGRTWLDHEPTVVLRDDDI